MVSPLLLALALGPPDAPPTPSEGAASPVAQDADRAPVQILPRPEPAPNWFAGGFVDVGYHFNSNRPDNHVYRGQLTTPRTGEFTINAVAAYIEHDATEEQPWHLGLGIAAGAGVDAIYAGEPVPGGANGQLAGPEVFKHIGKAEAGLLIRKSNTEIRGGLMSSPLGIGGAYTKGNWNYSTSWAANAAPYYLMGGLVEQQIASHWYLQGWVVNGWQTIADANAAPSYIASIVRSRGDWLALSQVYFGPDGNDLSPEGWRVHWDTLAVYDGPRWGVAGVFDLGQDRHTELPDQPQSLWLGAAAFAHGVVHHAAHFDIDLAARPEVFWDRDGLMFGTADNLLVSGTGTLSGRIYDHLLVRLEYRYDRSLAPGGFFYRGGATANDSVGLGTEQHTIFAGLVGYFEREFRLGKD